MTHPLWPTMRGILNQLELTSETSAPNPNATGGGKPGSRVLALSDMPDRDYWLERWNACRTTGQREDTIRAAGEALHRIRHTQSVTPKPESVKERTARILEVNNEGVEPAALALALWGDVTPKMIREARQEAGRDPLTGREWMPEEDVRVRARRLMAGRDGLSLRETARVLDLHMEKLRRLLKEAA